MFSGNEGMGAVMQEANFSKVSLLICSPTYNKKLKQSATVVILGLM